jgi:hypothetical protein
VEIISPNYHFSNQEIKQTIGLLVNLVFSSQSAPIELFGGFTILHIALYGLLKLELNELDENKIRDINELTALHQKQITELHSRII